MKTTRNPRKFQSKPQPMNSKIIKSVSLVLVLFLVGLYFFMDINSEIFLGVITSSNLSKDEETGMFKIRATVAEVELAEEGYIGQTFNYLKSTYKYTDKTYELTRECTSSKCSELFNGEDPTDFDKTGILNINRFEPKVFILRYKGIFNKQDSYIQHSEDKSETLKFRIREFFYRLVLVIIGLLGFIFVIRGLDKGFRFFGI